MPGVLLFGLLDESDVDRRPPTTRKPLSSQRFAIKREVPELLVVTDVCLCDTSHGHCGILVEQEITNDTTVEQLVPIAPSHRPRGHIDPSGVMDGRVGRIRGATRPTRLQSRRDRVLRREILLGVL